jgi:hypothetical protein
MKKPINEIAKMQRIAGIITESEYQEALSNKESDLQELTPDQMAGIAGAATGVAGGLAAALAAVKQEYNKVVKGNPEMSATEAAKQALMNAGRSLKAQFGGLSEDENQSSSLDVTNEADVLQFLADNGIDDDYFESMGGQEIENGSDEWMSVLSALTGKDAYEDEFDTNDDQKIRNFMTTIGRLGIEFI